MSLIILISTYSLTRIACHFLVGIILSCLSRNLPSGVVVAGTSINNTIYGHTLYAKCFTDANIIVLSLVLF